MSRKWVPASVLRARNQQSRQAQQEADAEAAFQDRAAKLLGIAEDNGDRAQDEQAIENAPALCVGYGSGYRIYRAQRPLSCCHCGAEIAIGDLFTSRAQHGAEIAEKAACRMHDLRRAS